MTELVWEGKYGQNGRRVAPVRVSMPFQTVETINESARERQRTLDLFSAGRDPEWRNRLIWGDKKYVLPALLAEFAGKVDLIYIDPPFDTGANFSFQVNVDGEAFTKEPSIIEQKAYRDTWGKGLDSYLQWFYETALLLHDLLAPSGALYVHLDSRMIHYAKAVLDEVFGIDNFRNQIVWKRTNAHGNATYQFGQLHDTLLFYARSESTTITNLFVSYDEEYVENSFRYIEPETGRRYASQNLTNYNKDRPHLTYSWKGHRRTWLFTQDKMRELDVAGRVLYSSTGYPRLKQYLDESPGAPLGDLWVDVKALKHAGSEVLPYPTQKPEALLRRIIEVSSSEGALVLDCFVGSGTTAAAAEKLNRRWLAADLGRFAIHTTRKRLLSVSGVRPFVIQNLGKYERQLWQAAEFGEHAEAKILAYRRFILDLYRAQPLTGYAWLHGVKAGRMVHVGSVDSPISPGDVRQIALELRKATGTGQGAPTTNGIDVLGWDFAFELNEVAKQQAALAKMDVRFVRIPREVLEKRAVEQGDIRFFELAALAVEVAINGSCATLTLTDFVIPLDDVPDEIQRAISSWVQWIDYWAIDWDNKGDAFHNEWQTYRSRQVPELQKSASQCYEQPGIYVVVVKVIDILGNDTTKTLKLQIG